MPKKERVFVCFFTNGLWKCIQILAQKREAFLGRSHANIVSKISVYTFWANEFCEVACERVNRYVKKIIKYIIDICCSLCYHILKGKPTRQGEYKEVIRPWAARAFTIFLLLIWKIFSFCNLEQHRRHLFDRGELGLYFKPSNLLKGLKKTVRLWLCEMRWETFGGLRKNV